MQGAERNQPLTAEEAQAALDELRRKIDVLDLQILDLLNRRALVAAQIGDVKKAAALPVYEPKREEEVFHNVTSKNPGPLSESAVRRLFERIIDEMRLLQKERLRKEQER
ncbi:MAG: chorismate mutase [Bryobacteraceae bacterium]|nr:MAG: chorismate mutase [Bryobacteraceae bacterium]